MTAFWAAGVRAVLLADSHLYGITHHTPARLDTDEPSCSEDQPAVLRNAHTYRPRKSILRVTGSGERVHLEVIAHNFCKSCSDICDVTVGHNRVRWKNLKQRCASME
eukprot:3066745-Pleurochrysis_carterae.AAC.1